MLEMVAVTISYSCYTWVVEERENISREVRYHCPLPPGSSGFIHYNTFLPIPKGCVISTTTIFLNLCIPHTSLLHLLLHFFLLFSWLFSFLTAGFAALWSWETAVTPAFPNKPNISRIMGIIIIYNVQLYYLWYHILF